MKFLKKTRNGKLNTYNEKLIIFIYFQVNLLRGIQQSRRMKKKHEKQIFFFFEKTRFRCNGKLYRVYQFSRVLYFASYIKFRPDQGCASCGQIAANNNVPNFFSASFREIHLLIYKKAELVGSQICRQFPGFLNNFIKVYTIRLEIGMLYHMNNTFENTIFQIYGNVPLMGTVSFNGSRFFQWKTLLLVKNNSFSESRSSQWKTFLLVETVTFSGSHFFQWKPSLLVENIPLRAISYSGNHSFSVEAIPCS